MADQWVPVDSGQETLDSSYNLEPGHRYMLRWDFPVPLPDWLADPLAGALSTLPLGMRDVRVVISENTLQVEWTQA